MSKLLFAAVSLALSAGANAQLTTTQTKNLTPINNTRSATTTGQWESAPTQTVAFDKFTQSTGVLTGVSGNVSVTGGTVTLSAAGTPSGTATAQYSATGNVWSRSFITVTGSGEKNIIVGSALGSLNETRTISCDATNPCFPAGVTNLSQNNNLKNTDTTWLAPSGSVAASDLSHFVGAAGTTINTSLRVMNNVTLPATFAGIAGRSVTQTISGLSGTESLTYSYLRHANASFSGGTNTDALTVGAGSGFSIFNFGDGSTTNLDYGSRTCTGDCGAFTVTLPTTPGASWNLAPGSSVAGTTALTASATSTSRATYTFTFKDDNAVGAANTQLTNTMQLTVAAVPEPSEWAMLAAGLMVIGFIARRRRAGPRA
jgi:hypothetical protein